MSTVFAVKEGPRPGCYLSREKAMEANPGVEEILEFDSYKQARRAVRDAFFRYSFLFLHDSERERVLAIYTYTLK